MCSSECDRSRLYRTHVLRKAFTQIKEFQDAWDKVGSRRATLEGAQVWMLALPSGFSGGELYALTLPEVRVNKDSLYSGSAYPSPTVRTVRKSN